MERKVLTSLARKLGITEPSVVRKAEEYMRLADIRSSTGKLASLRLNGGCRGALCLELAAVECGCNISREAAVHVSGMNRKTYNKALKSMECLLDIQPTTVADMSVQFGATDAKQLALQILKLYSSNCHEEDYASYSKALLNSGALYTACRHQKIKVDKKKFLDIAGVTRNIFDKQVALFVKEVEKVEADAKKPKSKRARTFLEELENMPDDDSTPSTLKHSRLAKKEEEDDYEVWKQNILTQAQKALGRTDKTS